MKKKTQKWHLSDLIGSLPEIKFSGRDVEIASITCDSRQVTNGSLFAALPGAKVDGAVFIESAVKSGASAILCYGETPEISYKDNVYFIFHPNPRRVFSIIAAAFFVKQPENIVAITGTNGKTSTAHFFRQICWLTGQKSASIGTIGIAVNNNEKYDYDRSNFLTTPDPVKLHNILSDLADYGVEYLSMEASSHGLEQHRLDGVKIKAASFTNLSRDHLDYHLTYENYFNAKMRLFSEVMPSGGIAVVNSDIPEYSKIIEICNKKNHKIISVGRNADYIKIIEISNAENLGHKVEFSINNNIYNVDINLVGEFQIYNLLCALGLAIACGIDERDAVDVLSKVTSVPGRMERVGRSNIFVDYSHTPDALEKALKVLRNYTKGKLHVVFGCGGDRDKGKRPQMGAIAGQLADNVIVTDDNPRSENPGVIRQEVLAGYPDAIEIGDRKKAIHEAINMMKEDDILLIAGKGHEKTQTIGSEVIPFDDVDVALQGLEVIER